MNHNDYTKKADIYIKQIEKNHTSSRPHYHFTAPYGWINDPNGLIFFGGKYHLFYQNNPYEPTWSSMHWGHAISDDMLNWEHLPIALAPSEEYDLCENGGVFSGTAIEHEGKMYVYYTAARNRGDERIQCQCLAISSDGIVFKKHENNPLIFAPSGFNAAHFRDPKVWKKDGVFYMICGCSDHEERGNILIFSSKDGVNFDYNGAMLRATAGEGFMWECPDLFTVDGHDILIYSPMGVPGEKTVYRIGKLDYDTLKFKTSGCGVLDYGYNFYAPQTLLSSSDERVMFGWLTPWRCNPTHNIPHGTYDLGWRGLMSIPRVLKTNGEILKIYPHDVLKGLQSSRLVEKNPVFECGEIRAVVNKEKTTAKKLLITLSTDDDYYTRIIMDLELEELVIDASECDCYGGGTVRLPLKSNDLHVFVDRYSIELFANDYTACHTLTLYPNNGTNKLDIEPIDGDIEFETLDIFKLEKSL